MNSVRVKLKRRSGNQQAAYSYPQPTVKTSAPAPGQYSFGRGGHYSIGADTVELPKVESWPELVRPESDIAAKLTGLRPGQSVTIRRGMFDQVVEVVELRSVVAFAAEKAQALVANSANSAGPIWSVRIVKDGGEIDVDILLRSTRERRKYVENAFHQYKQHPLPLCVLAKLIGFDPCKLILEWPSELAPLFVGVGSENERNTAFTIITNGRHRYVIDLLTIAELVRLGVAQEVCALIGRPLVAQTQREQLLLLMGGIGEPRESGNLSEQDGRLRMIEVPDWYFTRRKKILDDILVFIDGACDVVPTTGPETIGDVLRVLARDLDRSTLDTLYLCLEHNAVLFSEDGGLRMLSVEAGISRSMGVQPVLMQAVDHSLLNHAKYVDAISTKLIANHSFVCVAAKDLMSMARKSSDGIAPAAMAVFRSFRQPSLDFESGMKVGVEFIRLAVKELPPATIGLYAREILEALQYDRPQFKKVIVRSFSRLIKHFFGRNGRRLPSHDRRHFGRDLLKRR